MKQFLKDNIVLTTGIALPLALALVFWLATAVSLGNIEPPRTSVVYVTNDYDYSQTKPFRFEVVQGSLQIHYTPPEKGTAYTQPSLFVFNPVTKKTKQIPLAVAGSDKEKTFTPPELADSRLDTTIPGPDGYTFEQDHRSNGNLMTEIFGGGGYGRNEAVLRRNGARLSVPGAPAYNAKFIGWIVDGPDVTAP